MEIKEVDGTYASRYWIAYSLQEGSVFQLRGFNTEEEADQVVEQYKKDGSMSIDYPWDDSRTFSPAAMMKLNPQGYYVKVGS